MTEEELEIKFDHIQGISNRCTNHASQVMIDNIASESLYLDKEQVDKLEQQEYARTTDELVQLYIRYSVLNGIPYLYSISDLFWESGFYESLEPDGRRKYMPFSPLPSGYSRYEQDNTIYDEELPYFSVVAKTIILERYPTYLWKKKESKTQAEMQPQQKEPQPTQDKHQEFKIISHIAETESPFKSILNDRQIVLLADCINGAEISNAPMTFGDLKTTLSCKPEVTFRSSSNRQVVFPFLELNNRGLITPNW